MNNELTIKKAKEWERKIFHSSSPESTWVIKGEYILLSDTAFLVGYKRPLSDQSSFTWHIWLAGTDPQSRGKGEWQKLFEQFCRDCPKDASAISICSADAFPRMIQMLTNPKNGWTEQPVTGKITFCDPINGKKTFFKKRYFVRPTL